MKRTLVRAALPLIFSAALVCVGCGSSSTTASPVSSNNRLLAKDYEEQANETIAKNLKGRLLLIHGDIDDNVNPTETMHLVGALMTANKTFDMLIVPNMYHGDSGSHALYVTLRRWNYFARYLLGVKPPKNFVIHEAPLNFSMMQ